MMLDPRKTDNLTPSEECVYAFLGTTTYWRTAREVALSVGIAEVGAKNIICHLVKLGIVKKRKRNYGFDNGILEFKADTRTDQRIRDKRSRERWASITGVEPLHVKLIRFLGAKRAREAERYFK